MGGGLQTGNVRPGSGAAGAGGSDSSEDQSHLNGGAGQQNHQVR
jgi:hypothetical protein